MLPVIARLLADALLVGSLMFAAAADPTWLRGWILLAVMLLVRTAGAYAAYRVNPQLLRERARLPIHANQPAADRWLVAAVLATGFLGLPAVAGLDVARWSAIGRPGLLAGAAGLVMFAAGWGLKYLALHANAFATTSVRLQRERAHTVVDSGVYSVIRHPFYAADPLIWIGLGLWLESYLAVAVATLPITLMILRLRLEERFLLRELPGYREYSARVRHRLVPGFW